MRELFEVFCKECGDDFGRLSITEIKHLFPNNKCPTCKKEKAIQADLIEDICAPIKSKLKE